MASKPLECLLCQGRFSESDVENLRFFPQSMICFLCYRSGSKKDHRTWCFGKFNIVGDTGKILSFGYDPNQSADCKKYCPDRKICYLFATGKIFKLRAITKLSLPFPRMSILARAFASCIMGTTLPQLTKLIEEYGSDPRVVIARLKKGRARNKIWEFIEYKDGRVKIEMKTVAVRKIKPAVKNVP